MDCTWQEGQSMNKFNFVDRSSETKQGHWDQWFAYASLVFGCIVFVCVIFTGKQLYDYGVAWYTVNNLQQQEALFSSTVKTQQALKTKKEETSKRHDALQKWLHTPINPYWCIKAFFEHAPHDVVLTGYTFERSKHIQVRGYSSSLLGVTAFQKKLSIIDGLASIIVSSVKRRSSEKNKESSLLYDFVLEI